MGCLNSAQVSKYQTRNELIEIGGRKIVKQKIIAQGAYGQIWKCLQPDSNQIYALKLIRLQNKQLKQMFEKQVHVLTIMKQKESKNVVKIIESAKFSLDEYEIGVILMEFSHISLYEEIQNKRFTTQQTAKILIQVLNGLTQLHTSNFYHLDMKPENVIYCRNEYKICDLGSSMDGKIEFNRIDKKRKAEIQDFIESNSTLIYRSPEMIDTNGKVLDEKSDVWMVGLIGYVMLYRKQPFQNQGKLAILSPVQFPTDGPLEEILKKMLRIDSKQRIGCRQGISELKKILQ